VPHHPLRSGGNGFSLRFDETVHRSETPHDAAGMQAGVAEPALRAGASGGSIFAKKKLQGRGKPTRPRGPANRSDCECRVACRSGKLRRNGGLPGTDDLPAAFAAAVPPMRGLDQC
jgi:hypothetical protein